MDSKDFTDNMSGRFVKNLEVRLTFVPTALPPSISWTDEMVTAICQAEAALGRLAGIGDRFPEPKRLMRLFMRREAELSSRIENTYAGVRTQLLFRFIPEVERPREVNNNFRVLERGVGEIAKRSLSLSLIKHLHEILFKGIEQKHSGQWRTVQAHIGHTANPDEARFVPAPPHLIGECMEDLERFMQHNTNIPRIAKLAMIHYQFEAIHPFADGNGRIGRALILLLILEMGLLSVPLFNPSAYLESNRRDYYDHLLRISQQGAWDEWIIFFCRGLIEECSQVVRKIDRLERLRRQYHDQIRSSRFSANIGTLVNELFRQPVVRLTNVESMLNLWPASATRYIKKLVQLDILREVTGNARSRVFLAHEIVRVFSPTRPS